MFVSVCTAASFALNVYHLGAPSLWGDEGDAVSIASQHGVALLRAVGHDGGNFAVYYLVLHVVISVFGTGTDTIRMTSAVAATACVPLTYVLTAQHVGRRAGCMAAALTTVTIPLIYWAQQARGYTLAMALLLATAIALNRAMDRGGGAFVGFAVLAILSCYTELFAVIVVAVVVLSAAISPEMRRRWRSLGTSAGFVAVALVPLGLLASSRAHAQLFWLGKPTQTQIQDVISFLASARVAGVTHPHSHGYVVATVVVVCAALVTALAVGARRRDLALARFAVRFGLWAVLPVMIAYMLSLHYTPVFLDRYFLICVPAVTALIAYALAAIPIATIGWVGCALVIGFRAPHVGRAYNVNVDDWRDATTMVVNFATPRSCVAFYANDGYVDFAYYLEHRPVGIHPGATVPRSVLPAIPFGQNHTTRTIADDPAIVESYDALPAQQVTATAAHCSSLFVLSSHDGHNSKTRGSRDVWSRFVTMKGELSAAYPYTGRINLGSITIYEFAHDRSALHGVLGE